MSFDLLDEAENDLSKGSDLSPASALALYMSDLSEDYYCAGWMQGCEHTLWGMVEHGDRRDWGLGEITETEIDTLRRLSREAGGWVAWRDGKGATFVPAAEWKAEADEYRAK